MSSHDDLKQFLGTVQTRLAAFGKESYELHGRGVTRVSVPDGTPGMIVKTDMVYHTLAELQQLAGPLKGRVREEMATLIQMVETYDPETQIVVTVGGGPNVLSAKMRLNPPPLVEGPDTVQ